MRYVKANEVLPDDVIEIIQKYVDGEYVYIPRKSGNEKAWGEKNGTKTELMARNKEIFDRYNNGESVKILAEKYFLSESSIRRIMRDYKINILKSVS